MFGVKCTALSMCGLGGLPAFFGDTFCYLVYFDGGFFCRSIFDYDIDRV